jgi:PKHD-type hydroxylase
MYILRQNEEIQPIISISNFLSEDEINKIFDLVKRQDFLEGEVRNHKNNNIKNSGQKIVEELRKSNIKWISLNDQSNWLFKKIIRCINEVNVNNYNYILKFVEDFQFTEYSSKTKSFYSKHHDCGNRYGIENFVDIRKLSFSIQLSHFDDYEGGELKFHIKHDANKEEFYIAKKEKGTIIFFPSFILHEVTPVTKGVRYSLVSWVQGPNLL